MGASRWIWTEMRGRPVIRFVGPALWISTSNWTLAFLLCEYYMFT
jgi:hypothetical protein